MSKQLDKAFVEASKLPEEEQDALGRWLLEEIASERRWDDAFAKSHDVVRELADEALDEHRKGRSQKLDPDGL